MCTAKCVRRKEIITGLGVYLAWFLLLFFNILKNKNFFLILTNHRTKVTETSFLRALAFITLLLHFSSGFWARQLFK